MQDRLALTKLTQALWAYDRAVRLARLLKIKPAYELEDERWLALAFRAHVCGFRPELSTQNCVDFARQTVAAFANQRPAEHADALRDAG